MRYLLKGLILVFLLHISVGLLGNDGPLQGKYVHNVHGNNEIIAKADLYLQINDAPKAIRLLLDNLEHCTDSSLQSIINYKIGIAYLTEGYYEDALPYLKKFKAYQESKGDSIGIVAADIALGKYYCQRNDYTNASSIIFHALNRMPHQSENELKAMAFLVLAELNVQNRVFSEAKSYAQEALAISTTLKLNNLKLKCFDVFSCLYETMGDYQSALYYKNKSVNLQDSIIKSAASALTSTQHLTGNIYDVSPENANAEMATRAISVNLSKLKDDEVIYWGSIVLLFVFALVFFMLFRSKMLLSKKLKHKNVELEKLNATKDKFFSILAHDLKSPFNSLMGFSEVLSLQVESKSQQEIVEYSRSIHNSTRKLYSLVETLLQWSRTQLGTTEYKPERLDVKIVASNIISILKINAEEKDIVISLDISNNMLAWADKDLFSAVLRNLVSNAIKFSRVGSVISVTGKTKGSYMEISVTDTGVGISKDNLQKIFRVDTNITTTGTFNEKGTGLGLVLCKEFVEINKGVISAESKLEKGSTFKFTVPLSTNYSLN
ncbi:ATP-binding protein [Saccharicrinis sp. 156]|uniref:sensor histidine kinase n=1 Tax=Saccharicrinis sp. 156 TaxID=3417574 RepID=UPI003D3386EB